MENGRLVCLFFPFVFGLTALVVDEAYGYSSGASVLACEDLHPHHDYTDFQSSPSPYDIVVDGISNNGSYDATENITVSITAKPGNSGLTFKGFLLQAGQYKADGSFELAGSFVFESLDVQHQCGDAGVTHTSSAAKSSVHVQWITPGNTSTGEVEFRATVVQSKHIFWLIARNVMVSTTTQETSATSAIPSSGEPPSSIDTSQCGTSKGCYSSSCPDPNSVDCQYGVMWSSVKEGTKFELFASAPASTSTPWLALALSHDKTMDSDSVTDCLYSATGAIDVQMSWNEGHINSVLQDKHLSIVNGSTSGYYSNGMLFCQFTRLTYPESTQETKIYYPGTAQYHIQIAKGQVYGGVKLQHQHQPAVSEQLCDFTTFQVSSDVLKVDPLIKAHGIMMIIAWMVCASFGMILPRYYKSAWPGKTWDKKAIWFQLHQALMSSTLILSAAAFIIIFVSVRGYATLPSPAVAHPPLGIVVMALVIINPLMAVFRPAPNAPRRPLFNVCHFCVGLLAHLSAAVTVFLSLYITKLRLPEWCKGVMIGYIIWHAAIEILLAIHMHLDRCRARKEEKNDIRLDSVDPPNDDNKMKHSAVESYSLFRSCLALLHLVGVIGCSLALSIQIGIS